MEQNETVQIQNGHLMWGGVDTLQLTEQYGTPLYVMDAGKLKAACTAHTDAISEYFGGNGRAVFASKAFCCKAMYRLLSEAGLGADVVSGGELYTALEAGMDPRLLVFHGNNKTTEELTMALNAGIGLIVVDNMTELALLDKLCGAAGKKQDILLRIKPGVEAHTHAFIRTGQIDSKFGLALETGEAMKAAKKAADAPNLNLKGIHCHIGSQIFDPEPFGLAAKIMVEFLAEIREVTGETLPVLNLGGGFGIAYVEKDHPVPVAEYYRVISRAVKAACDEVAFPVPFLMTEPGRSIAAPAGITLYKVGSVKEIPNIRTYVAIDGGMTDNPRYALYQADYHAVLANKADTLQSEEVTIAGKCCESGDLLQEHTPLQPAEPGDVLAVFCTGAYNYSMASNYNRIPRPAVVFCQDGTSKIAVRRESYADLTQLDE